jgi:Ribbon-helix-helix protein, copG family
MKKASRKSDEPSRASLKEIPEVDFAAAKVRRNPYAKRVAREGISVQTSRGRPRSGEERGPTVPRSIRFPDSIWKQIEKRAAAEGISLHAALRAAVLEWMARHA